MVNRVEHTLSHHPRNGHVYRTCCVVSWAVSTHSAWGCTKDLEHAHTHTHRVAHICYIRQQGRESGSSNRAIRTPWDPIDLLIDPLLPQLVQTTLKVYTATTEKRTCNTSGWRWKELYKRHLGWHKKRSKCLSFMHPIFNLPSSHFHP